MVQSHSPAPCDFTSISGAGVGPSGTMRFFRNQGARTSDSGLLCDTRCFDDNPFFVSEHIEVYARKANHEVMAKDEIRRAFEIFHDGVRKGLLQFHGRRSHLELSEGTLAGKADITAQRGGQGRPACVHDARRKFVISG